jgi:hypothetical protein
LEPGFGFCLCIFSSLCCINCFRILRSTSLLSDHTTFYLFRTTNVFACNIGVSVWLCPLYCIMRRQSRPPHARQVLQRLA